MRVRARALVFTIAIAAVVFAARWIDYPALAGGFKGDEATYITMAYSVAGDFDLGYDRRDLGRFARLFGTARNGRPAGPDGIFLKPGTRPTSERLEFGKAFLYPLAAAPFAWLGGLGGMFVFNVLLLAGCVACAVKFCAARIGGWRGHALAWAFILASSTPIWAVWLTPEIFNFALVFYAYFFWLYKLVNPAAARQSPFLGSVWSDIAAAAFIGLATYSKVSNAPLVAPLVTYALWITLRQSGPWRTWIPRAVVIALAFGIVTGGLFAANKLITGDVSYQDGAPDETGKPTRKTFYGFFPFDEAGSTYQVARGSNEMVTDPNKISTDILFPGDPHFWDVLGHNAWYFFSGRDSGLVPYFFPGALMLALWMWRWRDTTAWQFFTFLAAAGTALILLVWTPYTWNGAGGPPGSRYFLSVYPLLLFLVPAGTGAVAVMTSWIAGGAFVGAMLLHPFVSSKEPWTVPERAPLKWLPIELTMMDDIPVRLNARRSRLGFGPMPADNPHRPLLYFMDENTYDFERHPLGPGYWIAGAASAEIVVRVVAPQTTVRIRAMSDIANHLTVTWGGATCELELKPHEPNGCELTTRDAVWAHGGEFYVLTLKTAAGYVPARATPGSTDTRNLGVFVAPEFVER